MGTTWIGECLEQLNGKLREANGLYPANERPALMRDILAKIEWLEKRGVDCGAQRMLYDRIKRETE